MSTVLLTSLREGACVALIVAVIYGLAVLGIWLVVRARARHSHGASITGSYRPYEIVGTAIVFTGLVVTGIYIPNELASTSAHQQAQSTCFTSVVALRDTIMAVQQGYRIAPQKADLRDADWEMLRTRLENAQFGCHGANLGAQATLSELADLAKGLDTAKAAADRNEPDRKYLNHIADWTQKALMNVQS